MPKPPKAKPLFTPEEMVSVRAFAPFEVQECIALWAKRYEEDRIADEADPDVRSKIIADENFFRARRDARVGGLGGPFRCHDETPENFGIRVAAAIFRLIKEV